jgi:hypothetical protein
MPKRMMLALFFMTAAIGPASAQGQRGSLTTETQDRLASSHSSSDVIWNLVGLLGLIGLIGLLPQHEEDSYHPSSFDE